MKDTKDQLNTQIHAGRRQKLRDRFLQDGLLTFNQCEVLEFALGYCIPRQDTNPAAHSLMNHFGSLSAILDAKPDELISAFGIGENAAIFLSFLKQMTTYLANQNLSGVKIRTPLDALNYLQPLLKTYSTEQFVIICLDSANRVKAVNTVTNYEFNKVPVNVREIISLVTSTKAAKVLVAHNHLNEDPLPSVADMNVTRRLLHIFTTLEITFLDHFIFAGDEHYYFNRSGVLDIFRREIERI